MKILMKIMVDKIVVKGKSIDSSTRCTHYHSPTDIAAIRFKCCGDYYPCYFVHTEEADQLVMVWPKRNFHSNAVFCGACAREITIAAYKSCNYTCPFCKLRSIRVV